MYIFYKNYIFSNIKTFFPNKTSYLQKIFLSILKKFHSVRKNHSVKKFHSVKENFISMKKIILQKKKTFWKKNFTLTFHFLKK